MELIDHWETLKIGKPETKWYIVTYLVSGKELARAGRKAEDVELFDWLSEKFEHIKFSVIPHWHVFTFRVSFKAGGYIEGS